MADGVRRLAGLLSEHWPRLVGYALLPIAALVAAWMQANVWPVAYVAAPLVLLEAVPAWRWLRAEPDPAKPLALGRTMGWALTGFLALAVVLAGTPLLAWPVGLVGVERSDLPRNWLASASLAGGLPRGGATEVLRDVLTGDWRYAVARGKPASGNLVVVLLPPWPPDTTQNALRQQLASLVQTARRQVARAVAFDIFFVGESESDATLVAAILDERNRTAPQRMQVFFGTDFLEKDGEFVRKPLPPKSLVDASVVHEGRGVLRSEDEGHLVAYVEADGVLRSIPLKFGRRDDRPSLAARIARYLPVARGETETIPKTAPGEPVGADRPSLLQFLPPRGDVRIVTWKQLESDPDAVRWLDGRIVIVGVAEPTDLWDTPFDTERLPGALVHAYAAESLWSGAYVRRAPWWLPLLALLYPCLSLAGRGVRGDRARDLVLSTLAVGAVLVLVAALAMSLDLRWIPVGEAVVGLWLFLPVVLYVRRHAPPPKRFRLAVDRSAVSPRG